MKKSLGMFSVAVISSLMLTGCPSGGSSNNNAAVGVGGAQINSFPNESCNVQASYYTCSQTINGIVLNSASVAFTSQQDFCSKLRDNSSSVNMDPTRGQIVAVQTRNQLFNERCQGITPVNPSGATSGIKTFNCQLSLKKGDIIVEGQPQQIYLSQYLKKQSLPAIGLLTTRHGIFVTSRWVQVANLNLEYLPAFSANPASIDQLKMSVTNIDGDISASVTGFAGAENKIMITPQDDDGTQTTLVASCTSADAMAVGMVKSTGLYQCLGDETVNGRKTQITYDPNQVTDVVASGISISNSAFVQGDGNNAVMLTQSSGRYNDSTLGIKSTLNSPTSISIEKSNYSLNVKCQPR